MSTRRRGPGPSHVPATPDHAGNVVGVDPHKRTLTATVADPRGGILASGHFRVSGDGHRALEAWARQLPRREQLPDTKAVRLRLAALAARNRRRRYDQPTTLRLKLLDDYRARIAKLDADDKQVTAELAALVQTSGSTLGELCGLSTVLVAELLVEVGDPRRF